MARQSFLIVDDNENFRFRVAVALEDRGYEVHQAADIDEGEGILLQKEVDYAVLDLRLEGGSGLDLLKKIQGRNLKTQVLLLTGYGSIATAIQAMKLGAVNYLQKPVDVDQILGALLNPCEEKIECQAIETPSLDQVEWEHIQRVLSDCEGNITKAARRMGMHRRTLQRKLKKHAPAKRSDI